MNITVLAPRITNASTKPITLAEGNTDTMDIPLNLLIPFSDNPRRDSDPATILDLSYSLVEKGQIQNLVVRPRGDFYEVYVGYRRYSGFGLAAERGDIATDHPVRCDVRDCDDNEAFLIALAENVNRENMTPLDECFGIQKAIANGSSPKELSRAIGLQPREIEARAAVAAMPAFVHDLISSSKRSLVWATSLARLSAPQIDQVSEAIANNENSYASVGQIQALAKSGKILVMNALFDVASSKLEIDADLFGAEPTFVDTEAFWILQNAAVEAKVSELEAQGHDKVDAQHAPFQDWKYQQVDSPIGAEAIISINPDGFVSIHDKLMPISKANVLEENADADAAFFGPTANPEENNDGEETTVDADANDLNISVTPPSGKGAQAMARWRRDSVSLAIIANPKLARRIELAAALGDTRLPQITPPPLIDLPAACPQSVEIDAYYAQFADAVTEARNTSTPFAYVEMLEDEEVEKLLAISTALHLPNQKGRQIAFTKDAIVSEIASVIGVDYREGFTPNEAFFDPFGLQDLRSLVGSLLGGHDALQARNAPKSDVVALLCQSFDDAANNRNLPPETIQRLNTWTPEYF